MASNEPERARWNDAYWTAAWPRREAMTAVVTPHLVAALDPREGEAILEVGSGGGVATFAIAERVGVGRVVGVDLSAPLVALARDRARERGLSNVAFVEGDAQEDTVAGGPFDAVASQFGVMFFDRAPRAFAHLRAQCTPGGRLAFACWAPVDQNPWALGPVLAPILGEPAPPEPGTSVVGPFALSDPVATTALLEGAGWTNVRVEAQGADADLDGEVLVEDDYLTFLGVAPGDLARARRAVNDHLTPLTRHDGRVRVHLTFLIVTARNPGA
ncbi:MAG: methyltransferase domain-containing protein [Acidobacteriota bacterium]|nr:methyltransferase domain-containing protein [Acidobacteriota bacterium]